MGTPEGFVVRIRYVRGVASPFRPQSLNAHRLFRRNHRAFCGDLLVRGVHAGEGSSGSLGLTPSASLLVTYARYSIRSHRLDAPSQCRCILLLPLLVASFMAIAAAKCVYFILESYVPSSRCVHVLPSFPYCVFLTSVSQYDRFKPFQHIAAGWRLVKQRCGGKQEEVRPLPLVSLRLAAGEYLICVSSVWLPRLPW